jgi:hypothetical protein
MQLVMLQVSMIRVPQMQTQLLEEWQLWSCLEQVASGLLSAGGEAA